MALLGPALLTPAAHALQAPPVPARAPAYLAPAFRSALEVPLPALRRETLPAAVPADGTSPDPSGRIGFHSDAGRVSTDPRTGNGFFRSLGANGRSCGTCHQPSQGMGLSAAAARRRFDLFGAGGDPLFAPVDGADCPNRVPPSEIRSSRPPAGRQQPAHDSAGARSLLLRYGLFRVFLPVPAGADYTLSIAPRDDPTTCNTDPAYARDPADSATRIVSVYRRPLISANLAFATETEFPPADSAQTSGNIMWDGREPTLASQVVDATLVHAQRDTRPPPAGQGPLTREDPVVRGIVAFETGFFSAQQVSGTAGPLTDGGAKGGARNLRSAVARGVLPGFTPTFDEYDAWADPPGSPPTVAARRSIRRGQDLFTGRNRRGRFTIADVPGFSDFPGVPNPAPGQTCTVCHNARHGGSDALPNSQRNIGTTGDTAKGRPLRRDLPVFTVACTGPDNPFLGRSFETNDPGLALISGKCADAGKVTVPQLRALAARAPYFHDGSARTLLDVVDFYARRFSIRLTDQDKRDLASFLGAL